MFLTSEEIRWLLDRVREHERANGRPSFGYSPDLVAGRIQAKLSIMLEVAAKSEKRERRGS